MVSQKPGSDKLSVQKSLLESNTELRSISLDSDDEVFWEGIPISTTKTFIKLIVFPSEDALTILYPLVELVDDKSQYYTSSAKLKLWSSHKLKIWGF